MKRILFALVFLSISVQAQFTKGVNLTNWFQSENSHKIQFTKYTEEDFVKIKSLGVDVIRLPINLHSMTKGSPDYELDDLFLYFINQVIDWAEKYEISIILDNHTFDPAVATSKEIENVLIPVWRNMALQFKERSKKVYYEILNEPHGIEDSTWNRIQGEVISEIRKIDTVHTIIVGPAGWNSYNNLDKMPVYEDKNLIYTFHFYEPFIFTHQGASWTDPSMENLANIPFPYNQSSMPAVPDNFKGTWIEWEMNNYYSKGTINYVREQLDIAKKFADSRNLKIFCGELGVFMPNAPENDRILWYSIVRQYLELKNIPWTMWDYQGGFGLFKKGSNELFDYDLNLNLLAALGFNVPPKKEFVVKPDSSAISIYSDYPSKGISVTGNGSYDFYSEDFHSGNYSLSWENANQYGFVEFNFSLKKDFTFLLNNNFKLHAWIKATPDFSGIYFRFLDTKEGNDDHPWRMDHKLNDLAVPYDNNWHEIEIPLSDFREGGSWDGAWFNPEGKFDWSSIDKLHLVSENGALTGKVWIDDLEIYNPDLTGVEDTENRLNKFTLEQNYPNPFNPETKISFSLPNDGYVKLTVFNSMGEKVSDLVNKFVKAGNYTVYFNGKTLSSGVYFYRIQNGRFSMTKKMILLK